jgi:hypothetical protein
MVLFQPSGPATVWDLSYYFGNGQPAEISFWIVGIVGILFGLFLFSSYLNNRKPEHLYWGFSFSILWILAHLLIFGGSYAVLLEPVPAMISALMVGFLAAGLLKAVKPGSFLANWFVYYVLVMSFLIGFFKLENMQTALPWFSLVVPIVVILLHVPSALLIVILPLGTRGENGKAALAMTFAGILMGLVGLLLAGATVLPQFGLSLGDFYLEIVFTAFPFVLLAAAVCFAWGTFVPKSWRFDIPGVELE